MKSIILHAALLSAPMCAADEPAPAVPPAEVMELLRQQLPLGMFGDAAHASGAPGLGLVTSPPSAVLRDQMSLKHGLVIDFVAAGSPAAASGLIARDILTKVDDQLVFNAAQLAGLSAYFGAGRSVTLTYLRQGKEATTRCVLGQLDGKEATAAAAADADASLLGLMRQAAESGQLLQGRQLDLAAALTTVRTPDGAIITIRTTNGVRHAEIKDAKGVSVFSGPVDTAPQRSAVPEPFRRYLDLGQDPFRNLKK